ncbi:FtsB family cell division protein [Lactococcus insecticola]|uniref:Septum formation initiation protein n=1 Tax=Pseudolactococcus insecticola TaxID=2709158 RepID=A0A6A0B5J7_9LACT|nr:septum formation initiator family protein [Lactococcus insecticola]GFH40502.1 septum formation initiation protein [Lactococcus insecticola]
MAEKKIVRLNNEFTNQRLNDIQTSYKKAPKRKHLGLILVAVILVMALPAINLVKSYETLQSREALKTKYEAKSASLDKKIATKKADIVKLKNPIFIEKYARAKYYYSKDGEKVFSIPDLSDGGVVKTSK